MNKYRLIFTGRDYSRISDCLMDTKVFDGQDNPIDQNGLPPDLDLADILIAYLDSYDEKALSGIFKNLDEDEYEDEEEKAQKKKLYTKLADEYWFNGQIGFLRKKDFEYKFFLEAEPEKSVILKLDITLRCISRFDGEKGYFLCSMLLHSNLSFVDSLIPTDDNDAIFEYMLLFRYVSLLRDAFVKGYYKKYVTFQNNDDRLKGSIDFARYIRLNSGCDNGKIAYSYRENTVKNPLNMLIMTAYQKLRNKYPDMMEWVFTSDYEEIINTLKAELGYYDCTISELFRLNSKPIYHPYYFEYESLRDICLKILRDEGLNLFATEEIDESVGYLVYVPNLWEKFLQDQFEQFDQLNVSPQVSNKVVISEDSGKAALKIRPDFVFYSTKSVPCMMLDAKFIPKWSDASENDDFSKVANDFNKCVRDMVCLDMHKTGVVFPCKNGSLFKKYNINTAGDQFYIMGIHVPSIKEDEPFYSWNSTFENGIKEQIREKIVPEFNVAGSS